MLSQQGALFEFRSLVGLSRESESLVRSMDSPRCSPSAAAIEDYRSPVEMERIRKVLLWFRQSEERGKEVGHKRPAERRANSQGAASGGDHEPG
jgi:hypothetical protein